MDSPIRAPAPSHGPGAPTSTGRLPLPVLRLSVLGGVALLSAAILLVEVALTRYFSFRLWYHYSFMIVGIAMLGLSAASSSLAVLRHRRAGAPRVPLMSLGAALCAATLLLALPLLSLLNARWVAEESGSQLALFGLLLLYWLVLALPFYCGGAAISWAVQTHGARISVLYAWDLVGGAVGCLGAVLLLSFLYPEQALAAAAALAAVAALLFAAGEPAAARLRRPLAAGAAALLLVSLALAAGRFDGWRLDGRVTPSKGLWRDLRSGGRIVASAANMTGRVDVVEGSLRRFAWGMDQAYSGPFPEQLALRIDGDALTSITRFDGDMATWRFADHMPATLAHVMMRPRKVLVIGSGGGMDLVNALRAGAADVTGVELNGRIVELMRGRFADYSGDIYRHPRVRVHHDDGRSFVERTPERYDLIQLTLVDTFAAISSGALSLAEDFLYTEEAFGGYVRRLTPDGTLALGRTVYEGQSLAVLMERATRPLGIDLRRHLFVAGNPDDSRGLVFLFCRRPFTAEEIARGRQFARQAGMELYYAPGVVGPRGAPIAAFLDAADRDRFVREAPGDLRAETDDRPFYFRASKWSALLGTYHSGRGNVLLILLVAVLFGWLCILVPLRVLAPAAASGRSRELAFFGCLGIGYITLEMGLLVRFTLFLGHPVRALAVTLFSLLLASGLGSGLSRGVAARASRTSRSEAAAAPLLGVLALGAVYVFALPPLFEACMGLALAWRTAIAVLLVAPLGLLMGMPLPLRLAAMQAERPELVLWAWGINGTCSVIGTAGCVLVAQLAGYRIVLLLGLAAYAAALACVTTIRHRPAVTAA